MVNKTLNESWMTYGELYVARVEEQPNIKESDHISLFPSTSN